MATMPIGVPDLGFGIDDVIPSRPGTWTSEVAGYYYVDNDNGTDSGRTYGTPAAPRSTIPDPIPAGAYIEVENEYNELTSGAIWLDSSGTSGSPVWITGSKESGATHSFTTTRIRVRGSHLYLDGLEINNGGRIYVGDTVSGWAADHIVVRNCNIEGVTTDTSGATMLAARGYSSSSKITQMVWYNNHIWNSGLISSPNDDDCHAMNTLGVTDNIWILNNTIHDCSGSGLQVNHSGMGYNIYAGFNEIYNVRQSGLWVKNGTDVIFSQNYIYDIISTPWSESKGMGGQNYPISVWYIYNRIRNCEYGCRFVSTDGVGGYEQYVIGNIFEDIGGSVSGSSGWEDNGVQCGGESSHWIYNNVFYDCSHGVTVVDPSVETNIYNNIFVDCKNTTNGTHIWCADTSDINTDNNLFYQTGGTEVLRWGSTSYNLSGFQSATGKNLNSHVGDPDFANTSTGDFSPSDTTHTLDNGASIASLQSTFYSTFGTTLDVDYNGDARVQGDNIDIGAYESGDSGVTSLSLATETDTAHELTVSYEPQDGWAVVEISNASTEEGSVFEDFVGTVEDGCQIYYSTADNTNITPSGVLTTDSTVSMDCQFYDVSDSSWKQFTIIINPLVGLVTETDTALEIQSNMTVQEGWQLPTDNYVSQRMPLNLVYPRPDSETQTHARHRLMHTVMPYRIPIGIQGGAWPFKYELTTYPAGATIGETHGTSDYGVVNCPGLTSGTHSFVVRVTAQDGNYIDVEWSAVVDDSKFTFIEDGYSGTKTGTITQPLESWADWYQGDNNDSTYANQVIVFRGGDYTAVGDLGDNYNCEINTGIKTPSLIGYPNETPVVDMSGCKILTRSGSNVNDVFVSSIRWESARQDVNNAHFIWATGDVNRCTWFDNYFYDFGAGTVGTDNNCAVFISSKTSHKHYCYYAENTHDDFWNNSSNGSYCDFYYLSDVVVERNTVKDSRATYGFWMKGTRSNVTVRANNIYDNVTRIGISVGYGTGEVGAIPHDHEVCWNRISASADCLLWAGATSSQYQHYDNYIYRNTFYGDSPWIRFVGAENYEVQGNVVVSDNLSQWDTSIMDVPETNITGSTSAGITDSTGLLIGASRVDYLGTKGFEVAGGIEALGIATETDAAHIISVLNAGIILTIGQAEEVNAARNISIGNDDIAYLRYTRI